MPSFEYRHNERARQALAMPRQFRGKAFLEDGRPISTGSELVDLRSGVPGSRAVSARSISGNTAQFVKSDRETDANRKRPREEEDAVNDVEESGDGLINSRSRLRRSNILKTGITAYLDRSSLNALKNKSQRTSRYAARYSDKKLTKNEKRKFGKITVEEIKSKIRVNAYDEYGQNVEGHGDLNNYEDGSKVDYYIKTLKLVASEESPVAQANAVYQLARTGGTVSGPKSYDTSTLGKFKDVSYKLGEKGAIDFKKTYVSYPGMSWSMSWKDPVLANSEVDIKLPNVDIDKHDRAQHFALGDYIYAKKNGKKTASSTTDMRRGKYTWHHLEQPYKMVMVDMQVHAKHGHNGGVYLW
ncbi:MAG: HNH endonuclease [Niveispirillum sp.]|uniref:HNH endonuclease n=1 Tax=Niveispirillum sp. TaxID=1917217 RepID=UPI003BA5E9C7